MLEASLLGAIFAPQELSELRVSLQAERAALLVLRAELPKSEARGKSLPAMSPLGSSTLDEAGYKKNKDARPISGEDRRPSSISFSPISLFSLSIYLGPSSHRVDGHR